MQYSDECQGCYSQLLNHVSAFLWANSERDFDEVAFSGNGNWLSSGLVRNQNSRGSSRPSPWWPTLPWKVQGGKCLPPTALCYTKPKYLYIFLSSFWVSILPRSVLLEILKTSKLPMGVQLTALWTGMKKTQLQLENDSWPVFAAALWCWWLMLRALKALNWPLTTSGEMRSVCFGELFSTAGTLIPTFNHNSLGFAFATRFLSFVVEKYKMM